jgi:protein SCO1/2
MIPRRAIAAITAALALGLSAAGAAVRIDPQQAVEKSRTAIGRVVGAYTLIDSAGAALPLRAYRGKPLVISLVYTACSSVCPPTTQHVIRAVAEARRTFGPDRFNVLTVGFDARNDTPAHLRRFAVAQGIGFPDWKLASADAATLEALLRDLGFSYAAVAGGFDHVTQTTIVDRDGKVFRHVFGDDFPLQMFIEPLKDAIYGEATSFSLAGVVDRIKFICTTFDPGAGRYRFDYGLMFGSVLAALSLVAFGGVILREALRSHKTRRRRADA